MRNDDPRAVSPFASTSNVSSSAAGSHVGAHTGRQRRFAARSARRWGDWSILEFPLPLLWLYTEPWLSEDEDDEYEFEPPVVVELWP
jgi:hypothetical protein